jgi:hypothetical protein
MAESYANPSCCLNGVLRQEHQVVGQSKEADLQGKSLHGHPVDLLGESGVEPASYRLHTSPHHDGRVLTPGQMLPGGLLPNKPRPDLVSSARRWILELWK